ncbi:metal-dependent hydrolase [Streptomyces sp. NBC_01497]|uniref:metal-dependent hydrolase n=1 Tax=Streptomyces sp. NBC_01497 TaxID=2903885 RepID=UPI002E362D24|nr:metal-dependent hydrolase [Streptomyces sp. NBC_01497]
MTTAHPAGGPPSAPGPPAPRRVDFDWHGTPLHWIPGEPLAGHVINVLHLLLPAGERWFVQVFKEALPRVHDPDLLARVKGFMGQEATHSVQHSHVLDHLAAQDLDTADFTRRVDALFERLLGPVPPWWVPLPKSRWILYRLAFVAAIEQFTAVLGDWVLTADGLDRAGADPVMLHLLRWHGAEEVEHRSVAFDMYEHCGGPGALRRLRRRGTMCVTAPALLGLWIRGTRHLIRHDPTIPPGKPTYTLAGHNRAIEKGLLPSWRSLGAAVPRYFRRSFHPSREGSMAAALTYLGRIPRPRGGI